MKTFKENLPRVLITALFVASACAEVIAQTGSSGNSMSNAKPANLTSDTGFIGKNMRDNKMEIDLSQLALSRSSSQNVKTAAQRMVTDHTLILNDLAKLAQNNNMMAIPGYPTDGGAMTTKDAAESNGDGGATGGGTTGGGGTGSGSVGQGSGNQSASKSGNNGQSGSGTNSGSAGMAGDAGSKNTGSYNNLGTTGTGSAPAQAAGNQQHQMSMQNTAALERASGAQFDKLWVSQTLAMHQAKLAELTTAVNTINDSDLKTAVNRAIPKVQAHVDMLSAMSSSKAKK